METADDGDDGAGEGAGMEVGAAMAAGDWAIPVAIKREERECSWEEERGYGWKF